MGVWQGERVASQYSLRCVTPTERVVVWSASSSSTLVNLKSPVARVSTQCWTLSGLWSGTMNFVVIRKQAVVVSGDKGPMGL